MLILINRNVIPFQILFYLLKFGLETFFDLFFFSTTEKNLSKFNCHLIFDRFLKIGNILAKNDLMQITTFLCLFFKKISGST